MSKTQVKNDKTPDGYDQNPGHTCPPVEECNRYVKDNSTADAETDASLVDVPLRCTEEVAGAPNVVASAPNSADAARLRLPDDLPEDIRNIKFKARIDDKSMLEVMDRDYREYLDDGWETHEDIRDKAYRKVLYRVLLWLTRIRITAYAEFLMEHYKIVPIKKYL